MEGTDCQPPPYTTRTPARRTRGPPRAGGPSLQELEEPAFAHAGMMSAAKAIFEDMTERGILQQARWGEAKPGSWAGWRPCHQDG